MDLFDILLKLSVPHREVLEQCRQGNCGTYASSLRFLLLDFPFGIVTDQSSDILCSRSRANSQLG